MYLITIIYSKIVNYLLSLKIHQDLANIGYKIDLKKAANLPSFNKQQNSKSEQKLIDYIPIFNIFNTLIQVINYKNNINDLIYQLDLLQLIVPLNEKERKKYQRHPNLLNAVFIAISPGFDSKKQPLKLESKVNKSDDQEIINEIGELNLKIFENYPFEITVGEEKINFFIKNYNVVIKKNKNSKFSEQEKLNYIKDYLTNPQKLIMLLIEDIDDFLTIFASSNKKEILRQKKELLEIKKILIVELKKIDKENLKIKNPEKIKKK